MIDVAGDELLTLYDVAHELGVHHATAWRYVQDGGGLPSQRLRSLYVVRRADLDAFKAQARPVGRPRKLA